MAAKQQPETSPPASTVKKGKIRLATASLALVLLGGGCFAGYAVARSTAGAVSDPMKPELRIRDGKSAAADSSSQIDGKFYKASYYPLQQPFTSNLANSDSIVQVSLGFGTFYDDKVVNNIKDNETAIRSLVLARLSSEDPEALSSPTGKKQLLADIRDQVNKILVAQTGYGGVENAYFTNLIVQ